MEFPLMRTVSNVLFALVLGLVGLILLMFVFRLTGIQWPFALERWWDYTFPVPQDLYAVAVVLGLGIYLARTARWFSRT